MIFNASELAGAPQFRACNPTMGTGIAMGIQTSFSDTANALGVMAVGSGGGIVVPDYVRLICTAAGSSTTSSHLAIVTDAVNRYSSGGTDLTTSIVSPTLQKDNTSRVGTLRFGAVTAAAASSKRVLARAALKTQTAPCWAVGDELVIKFGDGGHQHGLLSGSAAQRIVLNVAPIALTAASHSLVLHMWNPANATTPPSWECEWAWREG